MRFESRERGDGFRELRDGGKLRRLGCPPSPEFADAARAALYETGKRVPAHSDLRNGGSCHVDWVSAMVRSIISRMRGAATLTSWRSVTFRRAAAPIFSQHSGHSISEIIRSAIASVSR